MWCFLFVFILTSDKTSRPLVIYLKRGLVYIWSFLIKFQPFIMMLFSLLIRTWRTKAARLKPSEEKTMWVSFNAWILQNMIVMTAPGEDEGIKSYKTELSVKVKCEYFLANWIKQNIWGRRVLLWWSLIKRYFFKHYQTFWRPNNWSTGNKTDRLIDN